MKEAVAVSLNINNSIMRDSALLFFLKTRFQTINEEEQAFIISKIYHQVNQNQAITFLGENIDGIEESSSTEFVGEF